MPTTFSTALPAIATITRPANTWLMPNALTAGASASTNQFDVTAAATPDRASSATASQSGQRGVAVTVSAAAPSPGDSEAGRDRTNTPSRITATITENARSCCPAGAWTVDAIPGRTIA